MQTEQLRMLLMVALASVVFLMWQAWQIDYGPKAPQPGVAAPETPSPGTPAPATDAGTGVPQAPPAAETAATVPSVPVADAPAPTVGTATAPSDTVLVETDLLRVEIDPSGGTVRTLDLLRYPVSLEPDSLPFRLMTAEPAQLYLGQSGLLGEGAPNHQATFETARNRYVLEGDALEVVLTWSGDGLDIRKIYTFRRDSYVIGLRFEIVNTAATPWAGRMYGQFLRTEVDSGGGLNTTYTYTGGVVSTEENPYEKWDFSDLQSKSLEQEVAGGWVAMIQHYFATAWIPPQDATNRFYSLNLKDGRVALGLMGPSVEVAPGASQTLALDLYAGPKIQERMEAAAPNLQRAVDYGWLWMIALPLFKALDWIHGVIGNWGWSIIVLTLVIKLLFFHLSATSYKSMARMRKLQPRIVTLRERYANDKQRMNQAMMQLYKEEKINPLGGCLPIVVQIPVFIALYWVLLESVELRQASFIWWWKDLSTHDPYFVLPLAMGATMFIQQKLNPAPPDPMQAKIMMALPIVFTVLFLYFPSGLVLYWFVNNVLSIIQQWVITRKIVGKEAPPPAKT